METFYNNLNTNNDLDAKSFTMLMSLFNDDLCKILSEEIEFC